MYVVNVGHDGPLALPTTGPGGPTTAAKPPAAPAAPAPASKPTAAAQVLVANLNQIAHRLEQEGKADDAAICRNHAKTVEAASEFVDSEPLALPSW